MANDEITVTVVVSGSVQQPIEVSVANEPQPPVQVVAETAGVKSVNGKAGYVNLDKNDINLGNVENISITGVSGHLQQQFDNLDLNYATDEQLVALSGKSYKNTYAISTGVESEWYGFSGVFPSSPFLVANIVMPTDASGSYYHTLSGISTSGFYANYSMEVAQTGYLLNVLATIG